MKEELVYLGVDIAKSYLDAAIGNEKRRFANGHACRVLPRTRYARARADDRQSTTVALQSQ